MSQPKTPTPNPPNDSPEASTPDDFLLNGFCLTLWLREKAEAEAEGRSWPPLPVSPSGCSGAE